MKHISIIKSVVGHEFDITLADFSKANRANRIAWPRQIAMALTREFTRLSLADIGNAFGGRDHSTALYAVRTVKKLAGIEPHTRAIVNRCRTAIMERLK